MKKTALMTLILSAMLAVTCTGCGSTADSGTADTAQTAQSAAETASSDEAEAASEEAAPEADTLALDAAETPAVVQTAFTGSTGGVINTEDLFTERDLTQTADLSEAQYITVTDGQTVQITSGGVYVLSGTASECTVTVEADKADKVQLVLDGVSITNSDFPAIYVKSADKVFITAAGSANSLTVTGTFSADGDTNTDAVIFSKDDLVLNGTGALEIVSQTGNGVTSKDDLKITGGTYTVTAALDAFEANDLIAVCGGSFTVSTNKDAFHSENDAEGNIYIADGSFTINAKSDGVQATAYLQIDGGTFEINSAEGLESTYVQINGGTISISASDDGINAVAGGNANEVAVEINGGDLTIVMAQGDTDAIDANGSVYVNGGTIDITAPCVSFDYDRTAEYNGGTIIINGEQVSAIPQEMMGGRGGMGGFGGRGGFGGQGGFGSFDAQDGSGSQDGFGGFGGQDDFSSQGGFGGFGSQEASGSQSGMHRGGRRGFGTETADDYSSYTDSILAGRTTNGEI